MRPVRQIAFYIVLLLGHSRPPLAKAETIAHPDNGAARVEYFLSRPSGEGPRPTIIFLHGYQSPDARRGAVRTRNPRQGTSAAKVRDRGRSQGRLLALSSLGLIG
ncbi:hypothetical protein GCM10010983_08140 [Caulobacter rhizosphaerae]|jgi:hypothetical protein|nr:hypothetical protein GCM10010983_08140 [Caulobacter rhizosphaerae]